MIASAMIASLFRKLPPTQHREPVMPESRLGTSLSKSGGVSLRRRDLRAQLSSDAGMVINRSTRAAALVCRA